MGNVEIKLEGSKGFNQEQLELVTRLNKIMQLDLDKISSLIRVHRITVRFKTKKINKILNKIKASNIDYL